jgi:biotin transport system substrate-specific component
MNETTTRPKGRSYSLAVTALGVALLAVCSWIAVPAAIPFTLQTFAVGAVLGLLGGRRGTAAILCYLLLGAAGLPVFAGFSGGAGILFGTTGGYLLGFLLMGLCHWAFTTLFGGGTPVLILSLVVGLLLCYTFGTLWFLRLYLQNTGTVSLLTVLGWCVLPFVLPDGAKLALAVLVTRRVKPYLRRT